MQNRDIYCIVTAAGSSLRMNAAGDKLSKLHNGQPVLRLAVQTMLDAEPAGVVVVVPPERMDEYADLLTGLKLAFVHGGNSRFESVHRGLAALPTGFRGYVLVHDGARPFASAELVARVIEGAREHGACVPAVAPVDTVYRVGDKAASEVLPREQLGAAQTPQGFSLDLLRGAYERFVRAGKVATDEGSMVLALGHKVYIVHGERDNIKLTTPEDLRMLKSERVWRVGSGYDVHQLQEGRRLILGGVHVPFCRGLRGHSDADVLAHAIMDALLGAVGQGDIGMHFPDTSEQYQGADSIQLLNEVRQLVEKHGGRIENADATLVLEEPRLSPYKEEMRRNLARAMAVNVSQVNVKATTNERMGHIGRSEGIACHAVVSVSIERNTLASRSEQGI